MSAVVPKRTAKPEWQKFEDLFAIFDTTESSALDQQGLMKLVRACGELPRDDQLQAMMADQGCEEGGRIGYVGCVSIWMKLKTCRDPEARQRFEARREQLLPKVDGCTDRVVLAYRDMFDLYHSSGTGLMGAVALKHCMKAIGFSPTTFDIQKIVTEFDTTGSREIDSLAFLSAMGKYIKMKGPPEQRRRAKIKPEALEAAKEWNADQIKSYREMFDLFDEGGKGAITCEEFGRVVRALGLYPSNADIAKLASEGGHANSLIEFSDFIAIFVKCSREHRVPDDSDEELMRAFRVFDPESQGILTAKTLRQYLTSMGEPLTNEEVDDLLSHVTVDEKGCFSYAEVVRSGVLT